jgi:hypothetical protein
MVLKTVKLRKIVDLNLENLYISYRITPIYTCTQVNSYICNSNTFAGKYLEGPHLHWI